jgi:protein-S-isoprenylcysteine O-methyltransferase Ste14
MNDLALTRGLGQYRMPAGTAEASVRHALAADRFAKVAIVTLFSLMAMRLARDSAVTGHATGLLLVVNEALVVMLTVIRRRAEIVDRSLTARALTIFSTFGPLLVQPASIAAIAPDSVTLIISAIGLGVAVIGKLSLGRSFGLAPANRGVVSTGFYRFLRHPIYLGYLVTQIGFVLANPIAWNLGLLAVSDTALMFRAVREERTLATDPAYRAYLQRVRWRIVPGLF